MVGCAAMRNVNARQTRRVSEGPPSLTRRVCTRSVVIVLLMLTAAAVRAHVFGSGSPKCLDPAGWGDDHVGKPVAEFVTGDECLFCHREKIGTTWGANRHNRTIRPFEDDSPARAALKESPAKNTA